MLGNLIAKKQEQVFKKGFSIGIFEIKNAGYNWIEIQGVEKSGDYFPEIRSILIGGEAAEGKVYFAKEDFYWGRRGPSVHLNYQVPETAGDIHPGPKRTW